MANEAGQLGFKVNGTTKTISLLDETTGDLKSTFDVFKDIDGYWDSMSNSEQQALAISLAGELILPV